MWNFSAFLSIKTVSSDIYQRSHRTPRTTLIPAQQSQFHL